MSGSAALFLIMSIWVCATILWIAFLYPRPRR